jgi:DNA-directed RNA polymerase specialized sigma24 family protein
MRTRLDYEDHMLQKWNRFMHHHARRMFHPHRLAMDTDDIMNDLREALVRALRTYAWDPGGIPEDDFIKMVIRRRMSWLVRSSTAAYREAMYHYGMPTGEDGVALAPDVLVRDDGPTAAELYDQEELRVVCEALQYALRRNMPPAVFAVLHLRCVEELPAAEIARLANLATWNQVSNKVGWAKVRARAFLESLGIEDWDSLTEASIYEFTHEDLN